MVRTMVHVYVLITYNVVSQLSMYTCAYHGTRVLEYQVHMYYHALVSCHCGTHVRTRIQHYLKNEKRLEIQALKRALPA
jgi:hypothetical protein